MNSPNAISLSDNLTLRLDDGRSASAVHLTPREGLLLAEELTRRSFARMLVEEATLRDQAAVGEH